MILNLENLNILFQKKNFNYFNYQKFKEENLKKVQNKSIVIVYMSRTPNLIFALLMLFEYKITYIPIDPMFPLDRIKEIIDESKADGILTDINNNLVLYDSRKFNDYLKNDIALILFTSGSTGKPKGVEIKRSNLLGFFKSANKAVDLDFKHKIASISNICFDIFIFETIYAALNNLQIVLANEEELSNPKLLSLFLLENKVDIIQTTPSKLQLLINYDSDLKYLDNIRIVILGGESFPKKLLEILQNKTNTKIYNMYGPTETTIWATYSDLTNRKEIVIGKPLDGYKIFVVDENLKILGNDQIGEICIGGIGVTNGYLNNKELTKQKYIYLDNDPNILVYRTGDLGKFNYDNDLVFIGRKDNQIQLNGFRIELEEIEFNLKKYKYINETLVKYDKIKNRIIAFYTTSNKTIYTSKEISEFLKLYLPYYMIPSAFYKIEEFKYTFNGKLNRNYEYKLKLNADNNSIHIFNEVEERVLKIINEEISIKWDSISLNNSLNEYGIDSLSFIKIIINLEKEFNVEFEDEKLSFKAFNSINSIIQYIIKLNEEELK